MKLREFGLQVLEGMSTVGRSESGLDCEPCSPSKELIAQRVVIWMALLGFFGLAVWVLW